MADAAAPRAVPRFEYELLRILRFLLGQLPAEQGLPHVLNKRPAPPCLTADAVRLAKDAMAKGAVLFLVRSGGWRSERFLRKGEPAAGRVWERIPLAERGLEFSRHPLAFLMWLTAEKPSDTKVEWDAPAGELTPADELFFLLAHDALRAEPATWEAVRWRQPFARNPLCWLAHPGDFAAPRPATVPDFGPTVSGVRAVVLECLQPWLAARWLTAERGKARLPDWKKMRERGAAEEAGLTAFLTAAGEAGRTDLARFLLRTLHSLYAGQDREPAFWTAGLAAETAPTRLADRLTAQRAALAVVQQADTLAGWDRRARAVGYFDEGYAAGQLWKDDYEATDGPATAARARRTLDRLEPLRVQTVEGNG